jgi:protein tyrosine phosphatase
MMNFQIEATRKCSINYICIIPFADDSSRVVLPTKEDRPPHESYINASYITVVLWFHCNCK